MRVSVIHPGDSRPLNMDFDLYTEGDEDFKKELLALMIGNMQELRQSLTTCVSKDDLQPFNKTYHKVKPTINMLNDEELNVTIEAIKQTSVFSGYNENINNFFIIVDQLIKSLEKEIS